MKDEKNLWKVHRAAEYLNMAEITLYGKCERNEIPHLRPGNKRTIRFDPDVLRAWTKIQGRRKVRR